MLACPFASGIQSDPVKPVRRHGEQPASAVIEPSTSYSPSAQLVLLCASHVALFATAVKVPSAQGEQDLSVVAVCAVEMYSPATHVVSKEHTRSVVELGDADS